MKFTLTESWQQKPLLFLLSQTISLFGSSLVQYAITWYITLQTKSGMMMTISIVCGFLPTFLLSPFAGVWADRFNRKLLIILADGMIACATLILAILYVLGYQAFWLLFVISAIRAFGAAIQTPAVGALLPQLAPEAELTRVNAVNGSIQSLVMLLSPMLSALLLSRASLESIFFIDVVTAAVAITILLFFLHVPTHAKALAKEKLSYFSDFRQGIGYVLQHDFIKTLCLFNIAFCLLAAPGAFLTPLQVTRSFGDDVWRLTAIEITFSVGMMLGGAFMAWWGGFKNKLHTMVLANLIFGLCNIALGLIPAFWLYLCFMALIGVAMPIFNTPTMVLIQQKVEENFLGRVFGVMTMISSSMMPLGMLVFGPLADLVKIEWLLCGTGLLLCVQALFMVSNPVLIEAGKPMAEPES